MVEIITLIRELFYTERIAKPWHVTSQIVLATTPLSMSYYYDFCVTHEETKAQGN